MKSLVAIGLLGLLFGAACNRQTPTSHLYVDQTVSALGQGKNDVTSQGLDSCLNFTPLADAPGDNRVSFHVVHGQNELAQILGVNVAELGAGTPGNPLAQWMSNIVFEPRKANVLIKLKRVSRVQALDPKKVGLKIDNRDDYQKNYPSFVANCGDSFVYKIEFGDALYAVVPVVIDSVDQKDELAKKVRAVSDASALFALLDNYATLPAQSLFLTKEGGLKQLEMPALKTQVTSYLASPKQDIKVGQDTWSYQLIKAEPNGSVALTPDARQAKRLALVENFQNLAAASTELAECSRSADIVESRPLEFSAIAAFDQLRDDIQTKSQSVEETLENCRSQCSEGVCEPAVCVASEDKVPACDSLEKALQPTDAFIYRYVLLNPNVGPATELSRAGDRHIAQRFGKQILVRGNPEVNQTVVPLREAVYSRWNTKDMIDLAGVPKAEPRVSLVSAELQPFEKGNLIQTLPESSSEVFYVNHLTKFLGGDLPKSDEQSAPDVKPGASSGVRAVLETQSGELIFAYKSVAADGKVTESFAKLWGGGAFAYFWRLNGGINWLAPVESEKLEPGDTYSFRGSDGNYYWWSPGRQMVRLGPALTSYYRSVGSGNSRFGRAWTDETCDGSTCWASFDNDVLRVSLNGSRFCPLGQHAEANGECKPDSCGVINGVERFTGQTWPVDIPNGKWSQTCQADRKITTVTTCNTGYVNSNDTCQPAPCGNTPSGQNYNESIVGGYRTWECKLGQSIYKSVTCTLGFRLNASKRMCEPIPPRCERRPCRDDL